MSKASRRDRQRLAKQQNKAQSEDEKMKESLPAVPPFPIPMYFIGDAEMLDKATQTDDYTVPSIYDEQDLSKDLARLQQAKLKIVQQLADFATLVVHENAIQEEFQFWASLTPDEARLVAEADMKEFEATFYPPLEEMDWHPACWKMGRCLHGHSLSEAELWGKVANSETPQGNRCAFTGFPAEGGCMTFKFSQWPWIPSIALTLSSHILHGIWYSAESAFDLSVA